MTNSDLAARSQSLDGNAVTRAALWYGAIKTVLSWVSGGLFGKADDRAESTAPIGKAVDKTAPIAPLDTTDGKATPITPAVTNNNSFVFNINVENSDQLPGLKDKIKEMISSALDELNQRSSRLSFAE